MIDQHTLPDSLRTGYIARVERDLQHLSINPAGADETDAHAAIIKTAERLKQAHEQLADALNDLYTAERALLTHQYIAGALKQRADLAQKEADHRTENRSLSAPDCRRAAAIAAYIADRAQGAANAAEYAVCRANDAVHNLTS